MVDLGEKRDGSPLCVECGLCCKGVLHDRARLYEHEVEAARGLGLLVEADRGELFFDLPCPKLSGAVCTVYPDRPTTCRTYECGLLERYQDRQIELDEALTLVAKARQLLGEVIARYGPSQGLQSAKTDWRADLKEWTERYPDPAARAAAGPRRLTMSLLNMFIHRHFLNEQERQKRLDEKAEAGTLVKQPTTQPPAAPDRPQSP